MDPYAYVGGNPEMKTDPTGQRYIITGPGNTFYTYSSGIDFYQDDRGAKYALSSHQPYAKHGYQNGWLPSQGPNAPRKAQNKQERRPSNNPSGPATAAGGGG